MRWGRSLFGDLDGHRFTAIHPLHFDNSIFDFYCGLISGAALVPVETTHLTSPAEWLRAINDGQASVFFAVPTLFMLLEKAGLLTPQALPHVRHFLFGGEGFPIETLRAFHMHFRGHAQVTNVYGPTETSCICSSTVLDEAAIDEAGSGFVSLGRMHENFTHAILDPDGVPVARGEPGELWIGGPCVGLGYYRQPEETERRFRQDPRQSEYRSIFYRTGDLVREDVDGKLWFVGRADNQVKIAGHRIELEEIDFVMQAHAKVRRAVAVVAGSGDERELVAVFEADHLLEADELSAWCRSRLPSSMQPRRFTQLAELPRNANGKVDRLRALALASIAAVPAANKPRATAGGDLEGTLRQIWAGVLNLAHVPADANFFDLGGTSLLMIKVHTEIKRCLGREVSTNDLFAHPKIADLVRFLEGTAERYQALETAQSRGARQRELMQRMRKASSAS
jgi:D-alanine--poly(phosphoribitol) ligase subunit 1